MKSGIGLVVGCSVLYTIVMVSVRYYAHYVSFAGGLLTIAGMYSAACWYERRKERSKIEILPPDVIDCAPH